MDCEARKKPNIGGQALLEGLLMIGPRNAAMAVRKSDGGIAVETMTLPVKDLPARIPILRGMVLFFRQLVLGTKALMQSVQYIDLDEPEDGLPDTATLDAADSSADPNTEPAADSSADPNTEPAAEPGTSEPVAAATPAKKTKTKKFMALMIRIFGEKFVNKIKDAMDPTRDGKLKDTFVYFSVGISLVFSVVLFILFPNLIAGLLRFDKDTAAGVFSYNLFEGLFRITIFFGYILVVSNLKDIKRVWQYHGAEHKTIHCYENNEPLTVENIRKYTTKHPRCGTSFMFLVLIVSIIIFSFLGWHSVIINILSRLVLIPFVAGLSYELLKLAGRSKGIIASAINAPGLLFQHFTTKEPDDSQIEVAITAVNNLEMDGDAA